MRLVISGGHHVSLILEDVSFLVLSYSVVDTHYDFVSVDIYMSLHERHWLVEHIEASSYEVNIQYLVIAYHAEDSLVVADGLLGEELNDDAYLTLSFDCSFCLRECKNVGFVRVNLKSGWLVAIVNDVEKSVCC